MELAVPNVGDAVGDGDVRDGAALEHAAEVGKAAGQMTLARLVQPSKAESLMPVTLQGIVALVILMQFKNALLPRLTTLLGMVTLARSPQDWNAESPILATFVPMVALVRLEQFSKAAAPMLVTLPGIVTLVAPSPQTPPLRCWCTARDCDAGQAAPLECIGRDAGDGQTTD